MIETCVVAVYWNRAGRKLYGPFENEQNATLWVAENIPDRILFMVEPLASEVERGTE